MSDTDTERLTLHAIDLDEAHRIVDCQAGPGDAWAGDYPFDGDIIAVTMFLRATEILGEQRPFGYYRISRRADGLAIGGIGFKGTPADGRVEIGYGLAESARGSGYAAEAAVAMLHLAAEHAVSTVAADTHHDNVASQRTLIRAGFRLVRTDAELQYYEAYLDLSGRRQAASISATD